MSECGVERVCVNESYGPFRHDARASCRSDLEINPVGSDFLSTYTKFRLATV